MNPGWLIGILIIMVYCHPYLTGGEQKKHHPLSHCRVLQTSSCAPITWGDEAQQMQKPMDQCHEMSPFEDAL